MALKQEILKFLSDHRSEFVTDFSVIKLGIFGSVAQGTETVDSDIDIILDFAPDTPNIYEKKESIKEILQNRFGRTVDICTEKYIKPYFKDNILESAVYV